MQRGAAHAAADGGEAEDPTEADDPSQSRRLQALAAMQLRLLSHAFTFPSVRTVVYSTCSVHPLENEVVVAAALRTEEAKTGSWRLAAPNTLTHWPCRGLPLSGLRDGESEAMVRAGPDFLTNGFFVVRFERSMDTQKASIKS